MPCIACKKLTGTFLKFGQGYFDEVLRICPECLAKVPEMGLTKDAIHGIYKISNKRGWAYLDILEVEFIRGQHGSGFRLHFRLLSMSDWDWITTRVVHWNHDDSGYMQEGQFKKVNPELVSDEELPALMGLDKRLDEAIGRRLNR